MNGGDPPLLNYYHVITVSPTKFPKVNMLTVDEHFGG
jgi:ABC-type tungstate transport system permease subunit